MRREEWKEGGQPQPSVNPPQVNAFATAAAAAEAAKAKAAKAKAKAKAQVRCGGGGASRDCHQYAQWPREGGGREGRMEGKCHRRGRCMQRQRCWRNMTVYLGESFHFHFPPFLTFRCLVVASLSAPSVSPSQHAYCVKVTRNTQACTPLEGNDSRL